MTSTAATFWHTGREDNETRTTITDSNNTNLNHGTSPNMASHNSSQPNQSVTQFDDQQDNRSPQRLGNASQQTGGPHSTDRAPLNSTVGYRGQEPRGLVQTGYSHSTTASRHARATDSELRRDDARSRSPDLRSSSSTHLRQMPWDRLRGTPAYPNPPTDSSDSSESQTTAQHNRPTRSDPQRGRSSQVPRQRSTVDAQVQTGSEAPRRNPGNHVAGPSQNQASVSQNPLLQTHGTGAPQTARVPQVQTAQPPQVTNQTRPPNAAPLTQAALQLHTSHTPNPFPSRIQQTEAALQQPGPGSRPLQPSQAQPRPAAETKQAGRRPPTPPPPLRPSEFRTLPREPQREPQRQPRTLQPAHVVRPHGQRPHNTHRHAGPTGPQRHRGNPHMHTSPHRHGNVPAHRHPPHTNQVRALE
ncbi:hypothetical protein NFI96_006730 [Prochilodus magdalenae]|nr:hypothetical protein NFI96_006730 [Prochilodus magdalenae]